MEMLAAGDLRTDGFANEAARLVLGDVRLLPALLEAFGSEKAEVRGHAADALEKVARRHPEAVAQHLPALLSLARHDPVPMVRWHLAMLFGHMAGIPETIAQVRPTLRLMLRDGSPFVRSWAVTSLCMLARLSESDAGSIARSIAPLTRDASPAVAKRAEMALRLIANPRQPLPGSWVKRAGPGS